MDHVTSRVTTIPFLLSLLLCLLLTLPAHGRTVDVPELHFDARHAQFMEASTPVLPETGAEDTNDAKPKTDVSVTYPGAIADAPPGAPALPTVVVWIEIPDAARVSGIAVDDVAVVELGTARIAPTPGASDTDAHADPAIYGRNELVPAAWAEPGISQPMRGHHLAAVRVSPIRWNPGTGRLVLAERLRLRLTLEDAASMTTLARHRVVPAIEARFERGLERKVHGLKSSARPGSGPAGPGPYQPTFRPTTDGSPVEYVIITSDALATEFDRLAQWKTQKGVLATVRTVEWIDATYPNGVDRAERIRFFIRDAYQNWGSLWVLLGGDVEVVPVRSAFIAAPYTELIPSDYYYMCLDGNWNADGDDLFGEGPGGPGNPGDDVDLLPEVFAGRATVSTVGEACDLIDKTILYETDPAGGNGYPASALIMAERLFPSTHGAQFAEATAALLPPWFKIVRLYEESESWPGSLPLTPSSAIDSTDNGFGVILHVGRTSSSQWSLGDGSLTIADVAGFANGPRNSVVYTFDGSSAAFDASDAIAEHWLTNPDGGAIGYVGYSRSTFVNPASVLQNEWFSLVFEDSVRSLGAVTALARLPLVPAADVNGAFRVSVFALHLLGDPELDLYTNDSVPLEVAHAATHELGSGPFAVSVSSGGSPVAEATVTFWKQGETYATAITDVSGHASLEVAAETPGDGVLTVHKSYYVPYQATIAVTAPSSPYLYIASIDVDDDSNGQSSGDGDGLADAGETVELTVHIRNGGGMAATDVQGVLTADDPEGALTILSDTVPYGTIPGGGTASGASTFVVSIDAGAPVAYQPLLELSFSSNEGSWEDVAALPVRRPYLEHFAHTIDDAPPRGNGNGLVEPGEQIRYAIDLRNTGQQGVEGVGAMLKARRADDGEPHPLASLLDSTSTFGAIAAGAIASGDPFEFLLDGTINTGNLLLEVTFDAPPFAPFVDLLDVIPPAAPDAPSAAAGPGSITLRWLRPADQDVRGYDVYRSEEPAGPFERANRYMVEGSARFEDTGLPPLTGYYYYVVARDSSFNASAPSVIFRGSTTPPLHPGWPVELGLGNVTLGSPTFADVDDDPAPEILVAAGRQYALNADGTEVFPPVEDFVATQAVGDVDQDGDLEILNVEFEGTGVYLWDHLGQVLPGWPKSVLGDFNLGSPVLADLDQDSDLEIVVWAGNGGRLFAWHHDGTEVADGDNNPSTDGVLFRVFGTSFNYSSPAVCNLDEDAELEVVFAINLSDDGSGDIYAVNIDGSLVDGWPFFTGDPEHPSRVTASPAAGDLDGDQQPELVIAAERDGGRVYALRANGSIMPGWPVPVAAVSISSRTPSPVLADLSGDGFLDIVFPATDGQLFAWDRFGNVLPGFPAVYEEGSDQTSESTPVVADIDLDDAAEILFGDAWGLMHAFNHDGTVVTGFPIPIGASISGSAAVGDVDEDGWVEVAALAGDIKTYLWDLAGEWSSQRAPWPFFRHDARNTGCVPISSTTAAPEAAAAGAPAPSVAALYAPVPNPFNPTTRIVFDVPGPSGAVGWVHLAVYDVSGRLVRELVHAHIEPGRHHVAWDGSSERAAAPSGIYFVQLRVGDFTGTRKLVMLR